MKSILSFLVASALLLSTAGPASAATTFLSKTGRSNVVIPSVGRVGYGVEFQFAVYSAAPCQNYVITGTGGQGVPAAGVRLLNLDVFQYYPNLAVVRSILINSDNIPTYLTVECQVPNRSTVQEGRLVLSPDRRTYLPF